MYVFEVAKARTRTDLYQRFVPADYAGKMPLLDDDTFARYCVKMATGSGKTKVMALAVAWQYLNAVIEQDPAYAKTFLVIAPNVIVFERLKTDFSGGQIFKADPIIPREFELYWDMQCYMRGDSERASSQGALYLTNIQQLYPEREQPATEAAPIARLLGPKPIPSGKATAPSDDLLRRITEREGGIVVLNDEAHHTHDTESVWNETLRNLHRQDETGIAAQLDFSATPRHESGSLFAWTISDYTLKQAILDGIVKRPVRGLTDATEAPSEIARVKYEPFLVAGVERWREYREALHPLGKKPLLFVMMNDTDEADDIGDYLRVKYPDEFGGAKTLVIHTKKNGDITTDDLDKAREAARSVDRDDSPVNAIVSVLMLREGWDVQNVTVIVGLRPYTSKAGILPEQTIGRGLRLMFRGIPMHRDGGAYQERVDIIGNPGFIKFIDKLEKEEDIQLEQWNVGKDRLVITNIQPEAERAAFDISIPSLSPILVRAQSLEAIITGLQVESWRMSPPIPMGRDSREDQTFRYEGQDIVTLEMLFDRVYTLKSPQTSQEVVSYYAQAIAHEVKLPSQFSVLAPKVREFLRVAAFGKPIDLDSPEGLAAISRRIAMSITLKKFKTALVDELVQPAEVSIEGEARPISALRPMAWSQRAPVCRKTVLNKVPCDNGFEEDFARFLDRAHDVERFAKLPMPFGFSIPYTDVAGNLRQYYPDFVAVDQTGTHYLIETKGREDTDVPRKDSAARMWCEEAVKLTGTPWRFLKVMQKDYEGLLPPTLADCASYFGV
ncbi:MAG: DEAD/DEAH box helicase family protein [Anaerolineae bacterium]|nr:DEAD/DEAH box helicase family protein [Anaerolineae bacterium]